MTSEERQQVEAALGIVNTAVQNWDPKPSDSMPRGEQWRQMLAAWNIVSGIVQQNLAAPVQTSPSTNGAGAVLEEIPSDG